MKIQILLCLAIASAIAAEEISGESDRFGWNWDEQPTRRTTTRRPKTRPTITSATITSSTPISSPTTPINSPTTPINTPTTPLSSPTTPLSSPTTPIISTQTPIVTPNPVTFNKCMVSCMRTPEYNPLCADLGNGTRKQYTNEGEMNCANFCGERSRFLFRGSCTPGR